MVCNCPVTTSGPSLAAVCGGTNFMVFMGLLEIFLKSQCDIEDPCRRPIDAPEVHKEYDFIIVGGGTAGSVVASRLSEIPEWGVLVLEAGGDEPTGTQVPSMFLNFFGSDIDWNYETEPEEMACLGKEDQKCGWPRGKVLGGTSAFNGMMYIRGSRKDYDDWAALGNVGWSYNDVFQYFLKSEDNRQPELVDPGYHSSGGYLTIEQFPYRPPLSDAILEAGKELGYQIRDLNGERHTGFANAQTTSRNGSRVSSAKAFIRPVRDRPNLHIQLYAHVTRVLIDPITKRAYGVEYVKDGHKNVVYATKEVIVSGGAVNSPQILLLSGIGPREDLDYLKIPVVQDLKVGHNLQNHVSYTLTFTIREPETRSLNWATAVEYLLFRDGLMASTGISQTTAIINTKYANPLEDNPDIQLYFGGYLADCSRTGAVGELPDPAVNSSRHIYMFPTVLRPKSRGILQLRSADPFDPPKIHPHYLTDFRDMETLIEGIKFAIQLSQTRALQKYGFVLDTTPAKGCENIPFGSDSYWECAIRHDTVPENHQAGSVKMGPQNDPTAVVDPALRVYGIHGLRVIDASIMPQVTSGNTGAPTMMIAEKGSDLIKRDWLANRGVQTVELLRPHVNYIPLYTSPFLNYYKK